ncbi:flagellar hook-associated protein FlgK [Phaeobacter gallaeciensis]|uniref:flagellar hook-associated protein FlgK n=1 Tax=Phaeobacter gallaeciensis TaxID=60890 RepID=UPI00237FEE7C|nr:flagellar hook-associated protein FlgK [Phaeobacter gallaeciensis]MDE4276161.1 flagellar hook-associated protein FlgK [Phaeobacter gallaeciensis]MDE4301330.1 flagellar hook-associated protein FlgK [Phaeobacter gallaeciensis]MDE5186484.1 flagellar hook-associated protein FlgK [Phaeobacter gallaeciensis]
MSITSAINSAMSGLNAASRSSQIVSENLANALTPGYTRRTLDLNANAYSPGVRIGAVQRMVDPGVVSARRDSEAEYAVAEVNATFYARMSSLVGSVDDESSIASQMANFDGSLVETLSRPDSTPRLNDLAVKADLLVRSITDAADGLRDMRVQADTSIGIQVDKVNSTLKELEKLNARVVVAKAAGADTTTLLDQRSMLVDEINAIIPVNVINRDGGRIALYSSGGTALLEGKASELSFSPKSDMLPHMTQDNGLLSGLEVNGKPISTSANGPIRGGTLVAQFQVRDVLAVKAQDDLDAYARDLIERFQDPALDSTIGAMDAGIFTDGGNFFDSADTVGISGRLELNDLVAMDGQAETWRFRDGLYAATQGDPGDGSLINGYAEALKENRSLSSTGLGSVSGDASTLSSVLLSRFARDDNSASNTLTFAAASYTEMAQTEASFGVDTDAELQNLMLYEKAYGANAKVLSVVDGLLETILGI